MHASVELTQELIRFNTVNPPGAERPCAEHLAALLVECGICRRTHSLWRRAGATSRAYRRGVGQAAARIHRPPRYRTAWRAAWSADPFAAEIADGKLYGRGASDMKSGVAAFVTACIALADRLASSPGITLLITAGEETGCTGAEALAATPGSSRSGRLSWRSQPVISRSSATRARFGWRPKRKA